CIAKDIISLRSLEENVQIEIFPPEIVVPAPGKIRVRISNYCPVITVQLVIRLSGKFTCFISDPIYIPESFSPGNLFKATSGDKIITFLIDPIINPSEKAPYRISFSQNLCASQSYHMAGPGSILDVIAVRKGQYLVSVGGNIDVHIPGKCAGKVSGGK